MIVQTAPGGHPHFVITQIDHAHTSGQFARAFGNDAFAPLAPPALMDYVVTHHDEGWHAVDAAAKQDERTGLVYHLTQTPLPDLIETSAATPAFNEQHHALCGIISSMHSWGLYNGRYGLSDKIFIDAIGPAQRPLVEAMLQGELDRQARLKARLRDDALLAPHAADDALLHNYKLLQFFDTLALYFQMVHDEARDPAIFANVPRALDDDVVIALTPVAPDTVTLTPYPFASKRLEVQCAGRLLEPQPVGTDLRPLLDAAPVIYQTYTILAA